MKKIKFLMLDLKSYYNSPAYQLALLITYACTDKDIKDLIEFKFTEHPRTQDPLEIANLILDEQPYLVAMSNYSWNYKKICGILNHLKNSGKELPKILIGGPNSAGRFGVEMMGEYEMISCMVEGEGEPAFYDICQAIKKGQTDNPFKDSRNCIYRDENGTIVKPLKLDRILSLDEVPSPYLEGIIPLHPSPLFYETNRGCPYRCTFCYWGNGNSKVYRMSHDRIREEIEFFAKNKVGALFLADANFGIFPDDSEIAKLICEANEKYGYPIRFVGVNWAKNSSDRILEIASIFRDGKIGVATTLAIQSVTNKAEEISKRYAMPPSRFVNLVKSAEERKISTYTDIIWGLPGESYPDFLQGLEAVISTGVPSLMIHQLSLLPGTELFEDKEKLKIKLLSEETPETLVPVSERSDYYDYIVVSHQDMTYNDMKKGTRIMGISHVLHNHNLGKIVNFYLSKYDVTIKEVFAYFDELLVNNPEFYTSKHGPVFNKIKELISGFAEGTGNDETIFFRRLSEHIWFEEQQNGLRSKRGTEVKDFIRDFYIDFCKSRKIDFSEKEERWLNDILEYNWLVSPKPTWKPENPYKLNLDVDAIWNEMEKIIFSSAIPEKEAKKNKGKNKDDNWSSMPRIINEKLSRLLSDDFLQGHTKEVWYEIENPWKIPPSKTNIDWLLSARSRHCIVKYPAEIMS